MDGFKSKAEKDAYIARSMQTYHRVMAEIRARSEHKELHPEAQADCDLCEQIQEHEREAEQFALDLDDWIEAKKSEDKDNA